MLKSRLRRGGLFEFKASLAEQNSAVALNVDRFADQVKDDVEVECVDQCADQVHLRLLEQAGQRFGKSGAGLLFCSLAEKADDIVGHVALCGCRDRLRLLLLK